jgi:N-acetylglucosamine-6-phosphate deacetylase
MPIRTGQASHRDQDEYGIVKFTNCRLLQEGSIVDGDLWINTQTGRIADPQKSFFINRTLPNRVIDLEGKILAPGLLDVQINGAMGFDFSKLPVDGDMSIYKKGLLEMNQKLVKTGVTSYLATMTSQQSDKYHKVGIPQIHINLADAQIDPTIPWSIRHSSKSITWI